jgi:curved DNA-binding protein
MSVKFQDYYETLGVARTASAEEIKQGFRRLARLHHPDVAKNKITGEAKFKEINEAYEVLGDPDKRRRYDELGPHWQDADRSVPPSHGGPPPSGPDEPGFEFGGTGFSDFFESFFGQRAGGFAAGHGFSADEAERGGGFAQPGRDIEADLLVTLEETLHGSQRKITLRRPAAGPEPERTNTYQVKIPAGMREGQRIRLAGQGGPGQGGAAPGDLFLRVRLARHPDLRVRGDDLHCEVALAPWEAVLGGKVPVPALDAAITLRVPPGTVAGTQFRVRGQGLVRDNGSRGDLYATVQLQVAASVSPDERALWEKLAATSTFNPRKSP